MSNRIPFTKKDDELLVQYIAKNNPEPRGRTGNKLYVTLVENAGDQWPWAKHHPWQSWRERYRKDQAGFDRKIRQYQKSHIYVKSKKQISSEEEEEEEEDRNVPQPVASSSKTKLPSGNQPHANGSSSKKAEKQKTAEPVTKKVANTMETEGLIQSKPIPKPSHKAVVDVQIQQEESADVEEELQSLSEDLMHDLFGSFVEDDEEPESKEPSPINSPKNVYPNVLDIPAPTLGGAEPRMPGSFEFQPPPIAPEPVQPKPVPEMHRPLTKPSRPLLKKRKRKEEEDPFQSASSSPPAPVPIASKTGTAKHPPTVIEGPFRNTLKPANDKRTAKNNDEFAWIPKRQKNDHDKYNPPPPSQQQNAMIPLRRPPHVNAVASSSKTQLPPSRAIHDHEGGSPNVLPLTNNVVASSIPRLQTEPFLKTLGDDVLTRPSLVKKVAEKQPGGAIPSNHHDQPPSGIKKPAQNGKETRIAAQRPSNDNNEIPAKAISRSESYPLPTKPTLQNDPFTTNPVSDKAAGKARASDPAASALVEKPSRRIDFYQENLSKRLRAKASLPPRPSSVLSSRASTASSTAAKNKKPANARRSGSSSVRQSITALDVIPDDEKNAFAKAAAEDIASIMDRMAKEHGVSIEVAMKTYMRTRSIEKTKFILNQLWQTLLSKEMDLYAKNPDLSRVYDEASGEEEDEAEDSEVPEGLVSHKTPEKTRNDNTPKHTHSRRSKGRPSLNIKPPVEVDDPLSDYSPPTGSRAGQFARLVKQNRKEEAIEREKRRVSGLTYQMTQTQVGSPNKHDPPSLNTRPEREITVTPTPVPTRRSMTMEVDKPAEEEDDDDDDMYVDEEPSPEQLQVEDQHEDADDESDSPGPSSESWSTARLVRIAAGEPISQNGSEYSRGPSPSPSASTHQPHDEVNASEPITLEELILETFNQNPDLALEHQSLALNVDTDNKEAMQEFEAGQDPDFLRLMSIRLVEQILGASAQAQDMEEEEDGGALSL